MKFEEIFNEKGNYKAQGFIKGYCYEVDSEGFLWGLHYRNVNDVNPIRERAIMYKGMFDKNFVIVYNRGQLFD